MGMASHWGHWHKVLCCCVSQLSVGQKVMVNYNPDAPKERGFWYDGVLTRKVRLCIWRCWRWCYHLCCLCHRKVKGGRYSASSFSGKRTTSKSLPSHVESYMGSYTGPMIYMHMYMYLIPCIQGACKHWCIALHNMD